MSKSPAFVSRFWEFYQKGEDSHLDATMVVSEDGGLLAIAESVGFQPWQDVNLYLWDLDKLTLQASPRWLKSFQFFGFFQDNQHLLVNFENTIDTLDAKLQVIQSWQQGMSNPFYFNGNSLVFTQGIGYYNTCVNVLDLENRTGFRLLEGVVGYCTWYKSQFALKDHYMLPLLSSGMLDPHWQDPISFNLAYYHAQTKSLLLRDNNYLLLAQLPDSTLVSGPGATTLPAYKLKPFGERPVTLRDLLNAWKGAYWAWPYPICYGALQEWAPDQTLEIPENLQQKTAFCLAMSPDERWLLAGGHEILIWDLTNGSIHKTIELQNYFSGETCYKLVFLDKQHFVVVRSDLAPQKRAPLQDGYRVDFWSIDPLVCLKSFPAHAPSGPDVEIVNVPLVSELARNRLLDYLDTGLLARLNQRLLSQQEHRVVDGSQSPVFAKNNEWVQATIETLVIDEDGPLNCLALSEDDRWLVVGGKQRIHLWDLSEFSHVRSYDWPASRFESPCTELYFLDQERFLSRHEAYFVLWSVDDLEPVSDPENLLTDRSLLPAWSVQSAGKQNKEDASSLPPELKNAKELLLSNDGRYLFAWDNFLSVWDMETCRQLDVFQDYRQSMHCLALSQDGSLLAVGGKAICLWNLKDFSLIRTFTSESPCIKLQFLDPTRFLSLHLNCTFKLWKSDGLTWILSGWSDPKGFSLILTSEGWFKSSSEKGLQRYFPRIWKRIRNQVEGLTQEAFCQKYHQPAKVDAVMQAFLSERIRITVPTDCPDAVLHPSFDCLSRVCFAKKFPAPIRHTQKFVKYFWQYREPVVNERMAVSANREWLALASNKQLQLWNLITLEQQTLRVSVSFVAFCQDSLELLVYSEKGLQKLSRNLETLWHWETDAGNPFYFDGLDSLLCLSAGSVLCLHLSTKFKTRLIDSKTPRQSMFRAMVAWEKSTRSKVSIGPDGSSFGLGIGFTEASYHPASQTLLLKDKFSDTFLAQLEGFHLQVDSLKLLSYRPPLLLEDALSDLKRSLTASAFQLQCTMGELSRFSRYTLPVPDAWQATPVSCLSMSLNQHWLLACGKGQMVLWNLQEGGKVQCWEVCQPDGVPLDCEVAMFLDDQHVMTRHSDKNFRWWDLQKGYLLQQMTSKSLAPAHQKPVEVQDPAGVAAFLARVGDQVQQPVTTLLTSNGKCAVTIEKDSQTFLYTLKVWNAQNLEPRLSMAVAQPMVVPQFSPDQDFLLIRHQEWIALVDLNHFTLTQTYYWQTHDICVDIRFVDSRRFLSFHGNLGFVLWHFDGIEPLADSDGITEIHPSQIPVLRFCSVQTYKVIQNGVQTEHQLDLGKSAHQIGYQLFLRNAEQGNHNPMRIRQIEQQQQTPLKDLRDAVVTADRRYLYAVYPDIRTRRTLHLWDLETMQPLSNFENYQKEVRCLALSKNQLWLLAGGEEITLWSLTDDKMTRFFEIESPCVKLELLDSRHFLSLHQNGIFKIWQIDIPESLFAVAGHDTGHLVLTSEGYFQASNPETKDIYSPQIWQKVSPLADSTDLETFLQRYCLPDKVHELIQIYIKQVSFGGDAKERSRHA